MVARDPVACSRFFHAVVTAFLKYIIGTDYRIAERPVNKKFGVLGDMVAHYVTVESQNRGGLHAHGLYWMLGSLQPAQFMDRLKAATSEGSKFRKRVLGYFDTIIRESVPGAPLTDLTARKYAVDNTDRFDETSATEVTDVSEQKKSVSEVRFVTPFWRTAH
jgi:hypothetical protein